jgi:hypothetical protein
MSKDGHPCTDEKADAVPCMVDALFTQAGSIFVSQLVHSMEVTLSDSASY